MTGKRRRNGIKIGTRERVKEKRENKVVLNVRIKPELQEFIDSAYSNGDFKTKTAVVENALEFLRSYMTVQEKTYSKYGLTPPKYSDVNLNPHEDSASDSA
ncbi:MAG: hypothetical protein GY710_02145 [Desulfobacteraceae bacterium]|nr:hypothetical protein [Desulfobacteraceae bacterium]